MECKVGIHGDYWRVNYKMFPIAGCTFLNDLHRGVRKIEKQTCFAYEVGLLTIATMGGYMVHEV